MPQQQVKKNKANGPVRSTPAPATNRVDTTCAVTQFDLTVRIRDARRASEEAAQLATDLRELFPLVILQTPCTTVMKKKDGDIGFLPCHRFEVFTDAEKSPAALAHLQHYFGIIYGNDLVFIKETNTGLVTA